LRDDATGEGSKISQMGMVTDHYSHRNNW
jgi:hypothetical protein